MSFWLHLPVHVFSYRLPLPLAFCIINEPFTNSKERCGLIRELHLTRIWKKIPSDYSNLNEVPSCHTQRKFRKSVSFRTAHAEPATSNSLASPIHKRATSRDHWYLELIHSSNASELLLHYVCNKHIPPPSPPFSLTCYRCKLSHSLLLPVHNIFHLFHQLQIILLE